MSRVHHGGTPPSTWAYAQQDAQAHGTHGAGVKRYRKKRMSAKPKAKSATHSAKPHPLAAHLARHSPKPARGHEHTRRVQRDHGGQGGGRDRQQKQQQQDQQREQQDRRQAQPDAQAPEDAAPRKLRVRIKRAAARAAAPAGGGAARARPQGALEMLAAAYAPQDTQAVDALSEAWPSQVLALADKLARTPHVQVRPAMMTLYLDLLAARRRHAIHHDGEDEPLAAIAERLAASPRAAGSTPATRAAGAQAQPNHVERFNLLVPLCVLAGRRPLTPSQFDAREARLRALLDTPSTAPVGNASQTP